MEFSNQEYWSGEPFPSPGDLSDPGIEPGSPALQADSLPYELPGNLPTDGGSLFDSLGLLLLLDRVESSLSVPENLSDCCPLGATHNGQLGGSIMLPEEMVFETNNP